MSSSEPLLPWQKRSRSLQGRQTEKQIAKSRGARLHPNSGAGKIKDDASSEDVIYEVKDANKSHTVKSVELDNLLRRAIGQGKEAQYVVYFREHDLTMTCIIERGKK